MHTKKQMRLEAEAACCEASQQAAGPFTSSLGVFSPLSTTQTQTQPICFYYQTQYSPLFL